MERLPFLEGLRGLAALYVVIGHICSLSDPSALAGQVSRAPAWLQQVMAPFSFGHLAVAAFIVLSGFCLELSLFTGGNGRVTNLKRFFARRAKRILPAYYACLACSLVTVALVTSKQVGMPFSLYLPVTSESVLAHVLMFHNFSPDWMYKINGVLWSIAIEVQLYVVFPLLALTLTRLRRRWFVLGASLLAVAVIVSVPNAGKLYPWYFTLFALGMAGAHLAYRPSLSRGQMPEIALVTSLLALGGCAWACSARQPIYVCDAFVGVAVASIIYAGAVAPHGKVVRALSWKPIVALGGFSYSLYLMHHPILQLLYSIRPASVADSPAIFWYLLALMPIVLMVSKLFSLAFEKPFMHSSLKQSQSRGSEGYAPVSLPLRVAAVAGRKPASPLSMALVRERETAESAA